MSEKKQTAFVGFLIHTAQSTGILLAVQIGALLLEQAPHRWFHSERLKTASSDYELWVFWGGLAIATVVQIYWTIDYFIELWQERRDRHNGSITIRFRTLPSQGYRVLRYIFDEQLASCQLDGEVTDYLAVPDRAPAGEIEGTTDRVYRMIHRRPSAQPSP